jgi:hypothetical protein
MFAYVSYDENMISFSFPKSTTQSQEVTLHLLLSQGLTCLAVTCCPHAGWAHAKKKSPGIITTLDLYY